MKRFILSMGAGVALCLSSGNSSATDEWLPLQDGKTLAGWKAAENPASWVVEEGAFVARGERSHLFYVGKVGKHDFRNFELSAEVMTTPGANSGIYVHTRWQGPGWPATGYEMQVINSNPPAEKMGGYVEHKMTGSIYAVRNTWLAPAKDNEWFSYRIRVVGKTIQTFINDRLICEYAEPENAFRPDDKKGRRLSSGTFALQAHDPGSVVRYRNLKVKILPADAPPPAGLTPVQDAALDRLITQTSNDNIPLIDFGLLPTSNEDLDTGRQLRQLGMLAGSTFPRAELSSLPASVLLIVDRDRAPDVGLLKAAKAAGVRLAFSSGGVTSLDVAKLAARLAAIRDAGLSWQDFWVPGKP